MFYAIIIVSKRISRIVWRIDVNTFDTAGIVLFERFQRKQIIAVNQHIAIPRLAVRQHTRFHLSIGVFGILNQYPRFQRLLILVVLTNPSKFQFI